MEAMPIIIGRWRFGRLYRACPEMVHKPVESPVSTHRDSAVTELRFCDIMPNSVAFWVHKYFGIQPA